MNIEEETIKIEQADLTMLMPEERYLHAVINGIPTVATFEELFDFDRFDVLQAVTYVSSPQWLSRTLKHFAKANVIIGIDKVSACQNIKDWLNCGCVNWFKKAPDYMKDRLCDGSWSVRYTNMREPIHSKIFLLSNSISKEKRTIVGSINLTRNALGKGSKQYEEALAFDGDEWFEIFQRRYNALMGRTVDYIPEEVKKLWEEKHVVLQVDDPDVLRDFLAKQLEDENRAQVIFTGAKDDFEKLEQQFSSGSPDLSKSDNGVIEIIKRVATKKGDEIVPKTGKALLASLDKIVPKIVTLNVDAEIDGDNRFFLIAHSDDAARIRLYRGIPATQQHEKQLADPFFSESLSASQVDASLANIESFINTYIQFTVSDSVGSEYASWIYEAILYTMISPLMANIRRQAAEEYGEGILCDLPLYLVLGGRSMSGKSHLLKYLHVLLSGDLPHEALWGYEKLRNRNRYGAYLKLHFATGNRAPLFVDEARGDLFKGAKGAGGDQIKNFTNSLLNEEYAPIICTTNSSEYAPEEGAVRRLKYLPLDEVFDRTPEGLMAYTAALEGCNNSLEMDFLVRVVDRMETEAAFVDGDYLALARAVMLDYYQMASRAVPSYFPRNLIDNSTIEGRRKWRELWEDETKQEYFVPTKDNTCLRVEIANLYKFAPTKMQRTEYIDRLPGAVCPKKDGQYVVLNTERFFDWIEVENPFIKKSWLSKAKSIWTKHVHANE